MKILQKLRSDFVETIREFLADRAPRLAASLAYYAMLSLAPLLLLLLGIVGLVFGREAVTGELISQMQGLVGESGAAVAKTILENADKPRQGALAVIFGIIVLLIGATGAFVELQEAMNTIWNVKAQPKQGILGFVRKRLLSISMVLVIAFLMLVSLAFSAALAALSRYLSQRVPGGELLWQAVHFVVSTGLFTVLFMALFKYLPDTETRWRDVWPGALVTALFFSIGKILIGLYLGHSSVGSAYGAAGSLVVLLVWINYSCLILLAGAEYTQVHARRRASSGKQIRQKTESRA